MLWSRPVRRPPYAREVPLYIQDVMRTTVTRQTNGRDLRGVLTGMLFRFHYMWEYLGLPWKDVELLPPGNAKAKI